MNTTDLPNGLDPMAYLPPAGAEDSEISTYLYIASFGRLPSESRRPPSVPSPSSFKVCPLSVSSFNIAQTAYEVAPLADCQRAIRTIGALSIPALTFNSLLFALRARAVYGNSWKMNCIFAFSWICVVGSGFSVPWSLDAVHIGPTKRCVGTSVSSELAISIITNAVNNTFLFFAMSYRIISYSIRGDSWNSRAHSFFRGDGLPTVAKDLLQSGQFCYFVTILMSITQACMAFHPTYKAVLNIPGVALENAMTCRVHRSVILGLMTKPTLRSPDTPTPVMFTTGFTATDLTTGLESKNEFHRRDAVEAGV
ncbi:hypothetical protein HWV62_23214 [Athelia sp. TMB]|nr:hypothetical protein HWV62_23214 [Athelia sp. TMB]